MDPCRLGSALGLLALFLPSASSAQGWRVNGPLAPGIAGNVESVLVSPDGSRAVYRADQDADERFELYSVPLAGGPAVRLNDGLVASGDVRVDFAISADSSRVVYLADRDADELVELFSVPLAGGPVTQLNPALAAGGDVRSFRLAPDASRVVYRADQEVANRIELYSVPLAGGPSVKLNAPFVSAGDVLGPADVAIAPDASRVVYRADQDADQVFELYSVPLAGGAVTKLNGTLVAGGDVDAAFAIAPDASRVVYRADQDANDVLELFSVPLAGGVATQLHPPLVAGGDVQDDFVFAPDASRVVYRADQDGDEVFELYSVPSAGGSATRLNPALPSGGDVRSGFVVSPDSARVLYTADQDLNNRFELFAVALAGGPALQLNVEGEDVEPELAVSPDASHVLYLQDFGGELLAVPAAGGTPVLLRAPPQSGFEVLAFAVSPDSSRVLLVEGSSSSTHSDLVSVPLAGGAATSLNASHHLGLDATLRVSPDWSRALYLASQEFYPPRELYSVPVTGGAPTRLNPNLAPSLATVGDVQSARISADRRRVVYLADQANALEYGLYAVELPDGPPRRIDAFLSIQWPYSIQWFDLAPDTSRVVYAGGFPHRLHSVAITGGASVTLHGSIGPDTDFWSIQISPDSTRVVFVADADGDSDWELYSVPIGGGALTRLNGLTGGLQSTTIALSPDSSRVVYLADEDTPGLPELYSVPLAGGPATRLNPPLVAPRQIAHGFQVSPDASRVVYQGDVLTTGTVELFSVPLAGGASTRLNPDLVPGGDVRPGTWVHVSPDASRVVYGADQEADEVVELFSVPLAGGTAVKLNAPLVAGGDVLFPAGLSDDLVRISPDSSRVVYVANQDTVGMREIYSVPIDGSAGPVKLNGPLVAGGGVGLAPVESPFFSLEIVPPRISANSAWVVYIADELVDERFELFGAPLTGGPSVRLSGPLGGSEAIGHDFVLSTDSTRVVYRAGFEETRGERLESAALDGSALPRAVNTPLVPGGRVRSFQEAGGLVLYRADQEELETIELFLSFLTRPHRRAR